MPALSKSSRCLLQYRLCCLPYYFPPPRWKRFMVLFPVDHANVVMNDRSFAVFSVLIGSSSSLVVLLVYFSHSACAYFATSSIIPPYQWSKNRKCSNKLNRYRGSSPYYGSVDDLPAVFNNDTLPASEEKDSFSTLAFCVAQCLVASDAKRATGFDGASTGWTSWIDQDSEFMLRECLDKLCLAPSNSDKSSSSSHWIRWIKSVPAPLLIDLTSTFRSRISPNILPNKYDHKDSPQESITSASSIEAFLSRIACRIIVLPSGCELPSPFHTPTGGITYGKLLFGGVKRYRLIGGYSSGNIMRRAGERTAIMDNHNLEDGHNISPCWSQFGGPGRNYKAVDMGPAAFLELILLPEGLRIPQLVDHQLHSINGLKEQNLEDRIMSLTTTQVGLDPSNIFRFVKHQKHTKDHDDALKRDSRPVTNNNNNNRTYSRDTQSSPYIHGREITKIVGGLRSQIDELSRRVLVSKEESIFFQQIGLPLRPRGILLYGRPGTGKTTLAKEIARKLEARSIKAVAAPELLDKWVGGSEKLVRDLFKEAEEDAEHAATSTFPSLHVIIIDEFDAIFRRRSMSQDSGEISRNSLVNQLLAKIDGVIEMPNILVIGITNRKELIDEALLRPGRLEIQMHIPLPDAEGRREILQIHFHALQESGRLSQPLQLSISGQTEKISSGLRRCFNLPVFQKLKYISDPSAILEYRSLPDLAADDATGRFSGADIAGLVRCAGSIALARSRREGSGVDGVFITLADVILALQEIKGQKKRLA